MWQRLKWPLAAVAFLAVFGFHAREGMYPPVDESLSRWVALAEPSLGERLWGYMASGGVWLGYSYGVAAGFAAFVVLAFMARRSAASGALAAGGVTAAGLLAGSACFMVGCCGSPMLGVWVGLLGAAAAPWLGPVSALITTLSIMLAWRAASKKVNVKIDF